MELYLVLLDINTMKQFKKYFKSEYERVPSTMSSRLYVVFEYKDGDLLYEDKY